MNLKRLLALVSVTGIIFSASAASAKTMEFTMGSTSLYISDNGISQTQIETAPYTENNRTMVPLRFISENLGKDVSYIEATEQVLISDEKPVLTVNGKNYTIEDYRYLYNNINVNYEITPAEKVNIITNYLTESGVFSSLCENENYTSVSQNDLEAIAQYLNEQKSYIYENSLMAPGARFLTENTLALMYLSQKSEELCADADVSSIYETEYVMANHILQKKELPPINAETEESLRTMLIAGTFDSLYESLMESTNYQVLLSSEEVASLLTR